MDKADLVEHFKQRVAQYDTHKAAAEAIGISPQYLHDVLNGHREPGPIILKWLGAKKIIMYVLFEKYEARLPQR